ncbi:glutathione S-transferase 1-like [Nilaparvata lugens]|uniref:glutathione S-transferase 1-like n=1 Tax=Nilaparvata lugens TaxID=108931 RepID=UPI00193D2666|nr:glutathione S-transferase 1-like [Nilaparvata lugens]
MTIDFYYMDISPPVRAVNLCLAALNLEVNRKEINLFNRENLEPAFIQLNPQHTIPTIVDDGFVLWDSHAINAYLVSKYAKDDSLYPKDIQKRAIIDQRLHFEGSVLFTHGVRCFLPLFFGLSKTIPEDQRSQTDQYYEIVDKFLEGNTWIAGDQLTIADFSYISTLSGLSQIFTGVEKYKNISTYMDRCKENMKDYDSANQQGVDKYVGILKNILQSE